MGTADRGTEFQRLFPELSGTHMEDFSCAYQKVLLRQGRLYITQHNIAFYSVMATKFYIPFSEVEAIEKKVTLQLFHNAIQITTKSGEIHFFTSFIFRDQAHKILTDLWTYHLKKSGTAVPRTRLLPSASEPAEDAYESELSDDEGSVRTSGGTSDDEGEHTQGSVAAASSGTEKPSFTEEPATAEEPSAPSVPTAEPEGGSWAIVEEPRAEPEKEKEKEKEVTPAKTEAAPDRPRSDSGKSGGSPEAPVPGEATADMHTLVNAPVVQSADEAFARFPAETGSGNEFSRTEEFAKKQLKIDIPIPGITFKNLFDAVLSDQSKFIPVFHERRGDKDVQASNWLTSESTKWGGVRELRLSTEARGAWTPMIQYQRYAFIRNAEGQRLLLWQTSSKTPEVTYGKSFRVENLFTFREKEGVGLVMDAHVYICFVTSSMFKGIIESYAIPACQKSFDVMAEVIAQFCQPFCAAPTKSDPKDREEKAPKRRKSRPVRSPAGRTPTTTNLGASASSSTAIEDKRDGPVVAGATPSTSYSFIVVQFCLLCFAMTFLLSSKKVSTCCSSPVPFIERTEATAARLNSLNENINLANITEVNSLLAETLAAVSLLGKPNAPSTVPSHAQLLLSILEQQKLSSSLFLMLATSCAISVTVSLVALGLAALYFYRRQ
eukprot:TRINITY_DN94439_c0_g1_i1.p1 TRINITY_DN94439_c0_g1~~TRINITY_DN94439_c0_g1_i1.p1  ORF type:complete len:702 (+),score=99.34 TRINITY_DN94439_c0_g1_i1:118-2106(+)